jgi:hypothetical protein
MRTLLSVLALALLHGYSTVTSRSANTSPAAEALRRKSPRIFSIAYTLGFVVSERHQTPETGDSHTGTDARTARRLAVCLCGLPRGPRPARARQSPRSTAGGGGGGGEGNLAPGWCAGWFGFGGLGHRFAAPAWVRVCGRRLVVSLVTGCLRVVLIVFLSVRDDPDGLSAV